MEFNEKFICEDVNEYFLEMTELIFNQIPIPVTFVDSNCKIAALNNAAIDYLGFDFEEIEGKYAGDIDPNAKLPIVLKTGKAQIGSRHKFKGKKEVIVNRIPLFYKRKLIGGVSIIIIDDLNYIYDLITENNIIRKLNNSKKKKVSNVYKAKYNFEDILTTCYNGTKCKEQAKIFSDTDLTVLITGESGVGKELFAHAIHNKSKRRNKPFVRINCAAIPEKLIESELFGYESGAFTGASKEGKIGKFELANGGTIFLDEIEDIPLYMQTKLLRVLQENEIERVGGNELINIDVRIIVATNCNLIDKINNKTFREDLYYRINVLTLTVPPLRERKGDIDIIIKSVVEDFYNKYSICKVFPEDVVQILSSYNWPGNIRELKNILQRMIVLSKGKVVSKISIPDCIMEYYRSSKQVITENEASLKKSISNIENKIIIDTLIKNNFNKTKTAEELKIPRMTLYRRLKKIYPKN